jgi:predicted secreted acid phosphatase
MHFSTLSSKAAIAIAGLGLAAGITGIATAEAANTTPAKHVTADQIPNLGIVKNQIKAYYGDTGSHQVSPTSDYAHEMAKVETQTSRDVPRLLGQADASPVLLLDVDDTTLSTYTYEATHDFGFDPVENAVFIHDPGMGPTTGMPDFVNAVEDQGVEVYYLTGRPEQQRDDTLRDLVNAGYPDATTDHLFMRNKQEPPAYLPCEPKCSTIQYKSLTRQHIESLGNDIILNMGDQFSDLEGGFSDETVKLPNPMYFLP